MPRRFALLFSLLVACGSGQQAPPFVEGRHPGSEPFPASLQARLAEAWRGRPADYRPRTRHLDASGRPRFINRLFLEASPYLLQHAHNPVNWRPWGEAAFAEARESGRPVLLSVGYSTCHWCHVMEEESFEDEEIAEFLNASYIPIKVDREVRPDVDAVYMAAVQAFTGGGGWPMTVWLTPDRKPFYAGTYFPPRDGDRGARAGFLTLLKTLRKAFEERREDIDANTAVFVERIKLQLAPEAPGDLPTAEVLEQAGESYLSAFDSEHGGTRGAPKFPSGLPLRLLLRLAERFDEPRYHEAAFVTLDAMARGGIYDHVGGGFHRYAVDAEWAVPHFEKMLYDNALLTVAYLEAFQASGREEFAATARGILEYVRREMTSPEGGFYSATDADSADPESGEREEGRFFTWTRAEFDRALGAEAETAAAYFGVAGEPELEGRHVLRVAADAAPPAHLDAIVGKLRKARAKRPPPLRDDKILTAWNGLMISAFALASHVLDEPEYAAIAGRAADFVLAEFDREGRLARGFLNGRPTQDAFLDDYAFLVAGLIDLYEATADRRRLESALALDAVVGERYRDEENGGWFLTSSEHEELLVREKPGYDGAEPSGNSVHVMNLLRLGELTTEDRFRRRADRALKAFAATLETRPGALSEMLLALDFRLSKPKEIIGVEGADAEQAARLRNFLRGRFIPRRVLVWGPESELSAQSDLVPLLDGKRAIKGRATVYVCEQGVCELPTGSVETLKTLLPE